MWAARRLRRLNRADVGRAVIAALLIGGLVVGTRIVNGVVELREAVVERDRDNSTDAAIREMRTIMDEVSARQKVVVEQIERSAEVYLLLGEEFRSQQSALERELAQLRGEVAALVVIEESRRDAQHRLERWLESVETTKQQ
jgi:hypothetical protein